MIYLITALLLSQILPSNAISKIPTAADCATVLCAVPTCPVGVTSYTPEGACCPICPPDCTKTLCPQLAVYCPNEYTLQGECCPVCGPDCSTMKPPCPQVLCAAGFTEYTPVGSCCNTCILDCRTVLCASHVCELGQSKIYPEDSCCAICEEDPVVPEINCETCGVIGYNNGCNNCECTYDDIKQTFTEKCSTERNCLDGSGFTISDPHCLLDCSVVKCALPVCPDGISTYTPEGQCCPKCEIDCSTVLCPAVYCDQQLGTKSYIPDGECCPTCEIDCSLVDCAETKCEVNEEYVYEGCCGQCVPVAEDVGCGTCGTPSYSDGCNTCTCNADGTETGICSDLLCIWAGIPHCIEEINCVTCGTSSYYDGCNTCICDADGTAACTKIGCADGYGIPRCIPDEVICEDPETMEYKECGTACPKECGKPEPMICTLQCVQECQCKDGLYYSSTDGKCVEQIDCPDNTCADGEILVGGECVAINCDNCATYNDGCNDCICEIDDVGDAQISCTEKYCMGLVLNEPKCTACYDTYELSDDGICVSVPTVTEDYCPLTDATYTPFRERDETGNTNAVPGTGVCTVCSIREDVCETVVDAIADQFERDGIDIKDCVKSYCGNELGCDKELVQPKDDYLDQPCDCSKFECRIASNGVNQIGVMIGMVLVIGVFGWM